MRRKTLVAGMVGMALVGVIGAGAIFARGLDDLTFTGTNSYSGASVKAAHKQIRGDVVIPANAPNNNIKVSSVSQNGFDGCTDITSVSMPNNLTSVGAYAFAGCSRLSSVTLGTNRVSISSNAFTNCPNLTSVTFGATGGSVQGNAFPGDLVSKYNAGGSGTYTRRSGSNEWFKDDGRGGRGGGGVAVGGPSGGGSGVSINVDVGDRGRGGHPPPRGKQFCQCCGQPLP